MGGSAARELGDAVESLLGVLGWENETLLRETCDDWLWDTSYIDEKALPAYRAVMRALLHLEAEGVT